MGWESRAPAWMFMANRPRAGKDYLNGVAQRLYYGYAFEDPAIAPKNSEETEKRITTALAAGRRSIHNANQQGFLSDQAWIAAITSTMHRSRRLGSNDAAASVEYPNELELSMSANVGLQWREDVPDRCRFIRLAYFLEHANARTFSRPHLHEYVRQNRELLLSAIYSLSLRDLRSFRLHSKRCRNDHTPLRAGPSSTRPCKIASDRHGKAYKFVQYGFDPFLHNPCRDCRRNLNGSFLIRKFSRFWDCQRRDCQSTGRS
jgi:hypothetical protein